MKELHDVFSCASTELMMRLESLERDFTLTLKENREVL